MNIYPFLVDFLPKKTLQNSLYEYMRNCMTDEQKVQLFDYVTAKAEQQATKKYLASLKKPQDCVINTPNFVPMESIDEPTGSEPSSNESDMET